MKDYKKPKCPKCNTQLERVVSDRQKCSCPPYGAFACDECDFQGWVMYEWSDEYKEKWKDVDHSSVKFCEGRHILNQEFLDELARNMNG